MSCLVSCLDTCVSVLEKNVLIPSLPNMFPNLDFCSVLGLMQSTGLAVIWLFISVICVKCYCVADELNILQIGAGDCRHIVKTLAHCYQHPSTKINVSLILLHFYRIDRACD